jgi:glycosyltransferase involved in cell wall biosynthesis
MAIITEPELLKVKVAKETPAKRRKFSDFIRGFYSHSLEIVRRPMRRIVHRVWRRWPDLGRRQIHWWQYKFRRQLILEHQTLLVDLLALCNADRPVIIFAPSLDWNVQLFQRPQQLAMAFARQGALVFYMQPKPKFDQPAFCELYERMYLSNTLAATFDIVTEAVVYLLTWNSDYRYQFRNPRLLYDYVDDIDVFYGDQKLIAEGHRILLEEADWVVTTALRLYDGILSMRPDVLLCPNGVEYERFANKVVKSREEIPEDMQPILEDGKPVIGYYGALARWFDYPLVNQVAVLRPDYHFVLIGPDYDGTLHAEALFQRPNVHWLDVKPYAVLPDYLACFDVAIIPFIVSDITHATSPLKLFEYMAGGKPVVITPMEESMRYSGALVGRNSEEFASRLDEALILRHDPDYLAKIDLVAKESNWDRRARLILDALEELKG